ncbi:MAG: MerR family transcriptional regulator [Bacteroidales bacterium]|nr:MerR family transcriptional regulator [Bacteroidales bacterium]
MANYSIRDLENFTGIKAHTIRIWEKRYQIVEPKRTCTNIRYYTDEDLKKLLNVSILNRHGFKISNIVTLNCNELSEKILNLMSGPSNSDSQIESMVVAMIDMDEARFEKSFSSAVINLGFEEAMQRVIYPFFEKIGVLWQIGTINPAQEHFISNLLRQKLIVAIDGLVEQSLPDSKTFCLFLREGEMHELGLLFYHYIIKKNGHRVIYLGESVPLEALAEVTARKKVDALLTAFVTAITPEELGAYIENLGSRLSGKEIYLTGLQLSQPELPALPAQFHVIRNVREFKEKVLQ